MNKSFKNIGALLSLGSILVTATAFAAGPWSNSVTIADIEGDSVTGGQKPTCSSVLALLVSQRVEQLVKSSSWAAQMQCGP